jgi:hypothetical protein
MDFVMDRAWREENQNRVKRMREWYCLDERDTDPNHPHKGTFTGLYQEILIYEKWNKRFAPMA